MAAKFTDHKMEAFVLDVVNADDSQVDGSDDLLLRRYEDFFPTKDADLQLIVPRWSEITSKSPGDPFLLKELREMQCRAVVGELRDRLRGVWLSGYDDVAEWRVFMLQRQMHFTLDGTDLRDKTLYPPSVDTPLELAVDWIRRNLFMLRVCRIPECRRPFFVARRAQDRLCSAACRAISQKAHKRRSWRKKKHRPITEMKTTGGGKIVKRRGPRRSDWEIRRTLQRFLHDVVNAPENRIDYIVRVYAGFFPSKSRTERLVELRLFDPELLTPERVAPIRKKELREAVEKLEQGLQSIWTADAHHTAQWRLLCLQAEMHRFPETSSGAELSLPPADRPVHLALAYLRQNLHLLKTCCNPDCETPYFIADKAKQKYCSDSCLRRTH
jgi:hypothetical protein